MFSLRKFFAYDLLFLFSVLLLVGVGLLMMYGFQKDASTVVQRAVFTKQLIFASIGLAGAFILSRIHYVQYRRMSTVLYFSMVAVLVFVLVFGATIRGTAGWFNFGFFQFQPVELAKLTLIIFLASFIDQKRTQLDEIVRLFASFVLLMVLVGLVLLQPDFGSAMVLVSIWFGMMLVSGVRKRFVLAIVVMGLVVSSVGWFFLADYQKDRVMSVIHPEADARGSGYNVLQALVAVGSGGITGKGIGHGSQSQLNFLPEKHTDFVFAALTENLGFVGACFVLVTFGVLLYRLFRIAREAPDNFSFLFVSGVSIMLIVQVGVNVGMNLGMFPVTGIPLPLVSYGGSSLVSTLLALGIVLNISRQEQGSTREFSRLRHLDEVSI